MPTTAMPTWPGEALRIEKNDKFENRNFTNSIMKIFGHVA